MAGSLDFIRDLLSKLEKQEIQYHLIAYSPNKEGGNLFIYDNIEIKDAPIFCESMNESLELLIKNYQQTTKKNKKS